jgi:hypothetical protein
MSRGQKFFRLLWRVNAILIFIAAAGITIGVVSLLASELRWGSAHRQAVEAAPQVGASQAGEQFLLRQMDLVPGTAVLRGELQLHRDGRGLGSGLSGYAETRNLLYVKDGAKVGRWLLPDNDHVISAHHDVEPENEDRNHRTTLATVVLVKPAHQDQWTSEGELLLVDATGDNVQTVAKGVRELHTAAVRQGSLLLLYEANKKYCIAFFDVPSLAKKDQRELEVPQLK